MLHLGVAFVERLWPVSREFVLGLCFRMLCNAYRYARGYRHGPVGAWPHSAVLDSNRPVTDAEIAPCGTMASPTPPNAYVGTAELFGAGYCAGEEHFLPKRL